MSEVRSGSPSGRGTKRSFDRHEDASTSNGDSLFPLESKQPGILPILAILMCATWAIFLAIIPFVRIPITGFSLVLSNTGSTVYTGATTVLAGAVGVFVIGQLHDLWVADVLYVSSPGPWSGSPLVPNLFTRIAAATTKRRYPVHSEVRTIIGFGNFKERSLLWPQTLSSLILGLITAAIVTGLAPTVVLTTRLADQWTISLNNADAGLKHSCFDLINTASLPPNTTGFSWPVGNGMWLATNLSNCRTSNDLTAVSLQGIEDSGLEDIRSGVIYSVQRVAIRHGALGFPLFVNSSFSSYQDYSISGPDAFANFGMFGHQSSPGGLLGQGQLVHSEACLPVLTNNPVKCYEDKASSIVDVGGRTLAIGRGCNATISYTKALTSPTVRSGTSICSNASGLGTFVAGRATANTNISFTGFDHLTGLPAPWTPNFTISCQLDLRQAFGLRTTRLTYLGQIVGDTSQGQTNLSNDPTLVPSIPFTILRQSQVQFALSGTRESCVPKLGDGTQVSSESYMPEIVLASSIASAWTHWNDTYSTGGDLLSYVSLLNQNVSGLDDDISNYYSFQDSRNFVEDAIGTAVAKGLTKFYSAPSWACRTSDAYSCARRDNTKADPPLRPEIVFPPATMAATSTRVGSGEPWAIMYMLPPAYAFVLLVWLLRGRAAWAQQQGPVSEEQTLLKPGNNPNTSIIAIDSEIELRQVDTLRHSNELDIH